MEQTCRILNLSIGYYSFFYCETCSKSFNGMSTFTCPNKNLSSTVEVLSPEIVLKELSEHRKFKNFVDSNKINFFNTPKMDPKLESLINENIEKVKNMTSLEKEEMIRQQKISFLIAEAGFGSDKEEAEYKQAMLSEDQEKINREKQKELERMRKTAEYFGIELPDKLP